MSEFLEYAPEQGEQRKQDCETKAFHRLAERIKNAFPRLPVMVLLDGLYANGPIMERCRRYHWDFMIVLKDGSLPTVWEEYRSLAHEHPEHRCEQTWGERQQQFQWVNAIRYEYGPNGKKFLEVHVVSCHEHWQVVDPKTAEIITKRARHVWLSSRPPIAKWAGSMCIPAATSGRATAGASKGRFWSKSISATPMSMPSPSSGTR
ncbi:hypothetical protein [Thiorhodovibrio frisius]|uniref:hypothetical protein n=1 Tax=Thiorhodovibrio frisius TaxID=631362 RepID=UPI000255EC22|nr:hypothetical protein [Thiorhodovibrio frisius]